MYGSDSNQGAEYFAVYFACNFNFSVAYIENLNCTIRKGNSFFAKYMGEMLKTCTIKFFLKKPEKKPDKQNAKKKKCNLRHYLDF